MKRSFGSLLLLFLGTAIAQVSPQVIAVRATRMIDGRGGAPLLRAVVLVRGDRIEAAASDVPIPAGARLIDLGSATLLPGLIDLHTHLTSDADYHWEEALLKSKRAWYVPTLYVGQAVIDEGKAMGIPDSEIERSRKMMAYRTGSFRKALQAGLEIPFSTDAGVFPHGRNAREFALRVREGESPMRAIASATRVAAEALGWSDRVGTIEPGKFADLIAVAGNPLADITELEKVKWVMKGGIVYIDDTKK